MNDNWTYDDVRQAVITELELNQKPFARLDMSGASLHNVQEVLQYIRVMDYNGTENPTDKSIIVTRA